MNGDFQRERNTEKMLQSYAARPEAQILLSRNDDTGSDHLPALPEANYQCCWDECTSKLHNLATLRAHIYKRHLPYDTGSEEQVYACSWRDCEHSAKHESGLAQAARTFNAEEEWQNHIEKQHVQPLGWEYGDGPRTSTDHYKATLSKRRYLSDANGRETTPALPYNIPDDSDYPPRDVLELTRHYAEGPRNATGKADVNAQRAFLKAHGAKATDEHSLAEETLRAMVVRKQKIGPGIDRGGCTLINEARRATFVQTPGISRLIEADF